MKYVDITDGNSKAKEYMENEGGEIGQSAYLQLSDAPTCVKYKPPVFMFNDKLLPIRTAKIEMAWASGFMYLDCEMYPTMDGRKWMKDSDALCVRQCFIIVDVEKTEDVTIFHVKNFSVSNCKI